MHNAVLCSIEVLGKRARAFMHLYLLVCVYEQLPCSLRYSNLMNLKWAEETCRDGMPSGFSVLFLAYFITRQTALADELIIHSSLLLPAVGPDRVLL
jgi:hypothetical protein